MNLQSSISKTVNGIFHIHEAEDGLLAFIILKGKNLGQKAFAGVLNQIRYCFFDGFFPEKIWGK